MTELWIDGVAVVLPTNMSVTVKRENPFFTKNGEYTYEITLMLTNRINAELYGHLNRMNTVQEANKTKRRAVLIADNRVYCDGTEIITSWTDRDVKIQIASGNSELNYFIGGDLQISFLKMGSDKIPPLTNMAAIPGIVGKTYPEVNYCMPPIMTSGGSINGWRITVGFTSNGNWGWKPEVRNYFNPGRVNIYLQPYICPYIRKLMAAIGYKVVQNQLEDSEWNMLYFPQNGHPTEYAKMFPGWTVNEFVSELEKLFNLSFVVNNKTREVSILFKAEYYKTSKMVHVSSVCDEYDSEETDEDADLSHSNIKIEPPDSNYYRYQSLDEKVLSSATRVEKNSLQEIISYIKENGYKKVKGYLFYDTDTLRYYVADPNKTETNYPVMEVNMFGNLMRENTNTDVILNMIPADIVDYGLEPEAYVEQLTPLYGVDSERSRTYIPNIPGNQTNESEGSSGLYEQITSGNSSDNESKINQKLYVAFYKGLRDVAVYPKVYRNQGDMDTGPFDATYIKFPYSYNCEESAEFYGNLRLAYLGKMLYQNMYDIDVDNKKTITSYDPNVYDSRSIFEIRNKRYVCKDMEYTITVNGRKGAWTGTFYPIKISDGEADKRWILTDGKWRDGGVWLDNGRWLDE